VLLTRGTTFRVGVVECMLVILSGVFPVGFSNIPNLEKFNHRGLFGFNCNAWPRGFHEVFQRPPNQSPVRPSNLTQSQSHKVTRSVYDTVTPSPDRPRPNPVKFRVRSIKIGINIVSIDSATVAQSLQPFPPTNLCAMRMGVLRHRIICACIHVVYYINLT
jgi:hypothetical protein